MIHLTLILRSRTPVKKHALIISHSILDRIYGITRYHETEKKGVDAKKKERNKRALTVQYFSYLER